MIDLCTGCSHLSRGNVGISFNCCSNEIEVEVSRSTRIINFSFRPRLIAIEDLEGITSVAIYFVFASFTLVRFNSVEGR